MSRRLQFSRDPHTFRDRNERRFDDMVRNMHADMRSTMRHSLDGGFDPSFGGLRYPFNTDAQSSFDSSVREKSFGNPVIYHDPVTNSRRFEANFDLAQFRPEDIAIKLDNGMINVETKETTFENGVRNTTTFNRKVHLSSDVDVNKLSSILSADGILTIHGPVGPESSSKPSTPSRLASGSKSPQITRRATHAGTSAANDSAAAGAPVKVITAPPSRPRPRLEEPTFFNTAKGRELVLLVDIGKAYSPEDISVKVEDFVISIQAEHITRTGVKKSSCSMNRDFTITEIIDPATVTANIKDGILEINAMAVK